MLDIAHIVQQSRTTADRLDMVLGAALSGQCSPDHAAKLAYVGIGIAANNAMQINAARVGNGLGVLAAPTAWKGVTTAQ